jgi:zinc protease
MTLEETLAVRPSPGHPRTYRFPDFDRTVLASGMQVLTVDIPGRPLVTASLVIRRGAVDEPGDLAGATVLASRAMTEGTERYPGVELTEAAERLGANLNVEASWDAFFAAVEVAAKRLPAALDLLAEVVRRPTFPADDVERLRDERLNDLMQVKADSRRWVDRVFSETIYSSDSPYRRPAAGDEQSVPRLSADVLRDVHRALLAPERAALIVGGDLSGLDLSGLAERTIGALGSGAAGEPSAPVSTPSVTEPIVRFFHKPGAVQTEVRIGHVGLPRKVSDFHAIAVMQAILGGLFNSRLQMNLRESKGYTYGVSASFDMRRGRGPFSVRTAVHTEATVPAITEALTELNRMRDTEVTPAELNAARDYLVGVFPLRFETPGAVVGAVGGLFVQGLPDDELAHYRGRIESVTAGQVQAAAHDHIHLDRLAIVAVGDADAVGKDLEAAGFGRLEIVRDQDSADAGAQG